MKRDKESNNTLIIFVGIVVIILLFLIFMLYMLGPKSSDHEKSGTTTASIKVENEDDKVDENDNTNGNLTNGEGVTEVPETPNGTTTTSNVGTTTKPSGTTTTNKVVISGSISKVSTTKFNEDINCVRLRPVKTRNTDLDNKIQKIINSVTTSDMTNNEKLYAVFRYVIDYAKYGNSVISMNEQQDLKNKYHYYDMDGAIVYYAISILDEREGVCDNYAALLTVLARRLGFEAYYVGGSVKKAGGGTTPHAWVNIKANGSWYNLDAQIADSRPNQEKYCYGKTDSEANLYKYDRTSYVNDFKSFKEATPLRLQVNLGGAISDTKTVDSYGSNALKDVSYKAYKGSTLNINIKMSGASKYRYSVSVRSYDTYTDESLYNKANETKNNISVSKKLTADKGYKIFISVWSGDTGNIAEYIFSVSVFDDDRMKDLNVSIKKVPNGLKQPHNYTATFNATVSKVNPNSTCVPKYEYKFISSNDTSTPTGYYGIYSKDGGPRNNMDYIPGKKYNVKVIVRCGSESLEKNFVVS